MSTDKRFSIVHLRSRDICDIQDHNQSIPTFYNDLGYIESVQPVCDLLNELDSENKYLKKQVEDLKLSYDILMALCEHNNIL